MPGATGRLIGTAEAPLPDTIGKNDLVNVRRLAGPEDVLQFALDMEPPLEGALVSIDLATGYVRALVGGYEFNRSQFNRATQAVRQPGSAFKPFIYAAALDRGYTPASIIVDEPIVLAGAHEAWTPHNFDNKYNGPTTLRDALTFSRNVVTVKLAQNIGLNYLVTYLQRFGFSRTFGKNLSIALGTQEVTLLELTRAYTVFGNQGRLDDPIFITKITDPHGAVLEEFKPSSKPVISPETSYLVTSMLESVVAAWNRSARAGSRAPGRRQDRHDERLPRRVVHRLHARARDRRVDRLRQRAQPREKPNRRQDRGAGLQGLHAGGARQSADHRFPDPARHHVRQHRPRHRPCRLARRHRVLPRSVQARQRAALSRAGRGGAALRRRPRAHHRPHACARRRRRILRRRRSPAARRGVGHRGAGRERARRAPARRRRDRAVASADRPADVDDTRNDDAYRRNRPRRFDDEDASRANRDRRAPPRMDDYLAPLDDREFDRPTRRRGEAEAGDYRSNAPRSRRRIIEEPLD